MYVELVSDRRARRRRRVLLSWVAAAGTCGYLLPWAIATTRGKANADVVGFVNLVLGWTIIGWFVAFVLACRGHGIAGLRITGLATVLSVLSNQVGAEGIEPPTTSL